VNVRLTSKGTLVSALVATMLFFSAVSAGAVTFNVVNNDGPGEGFNDPTPVQPVGGNSGTTLGQQRLIAFQYAADLWGAVVASSATLIVNATFDPLFCSSNSAVLGQAGATTIHGNFPNAPSSNTWYVVGLANILSGTDLNGATPEIQAQFNSEIDTGCLSGRLFYYGLDGQQGQNTDFVTVLLHELGHGLGFLSAVDLTTGSKHNGLDDAFMLCLEDHSTGKQFPNMTDGERVAAMIDGSQTSSDLHWTCSATVTEAPKHLTTGIGAGGHVEMYAPNPAEPGSSVSHFAKTLSPNELMEPAFTSPLHEVAMTLGVFADIGYPGLIKCGDANRDGSISATDALFALKTAVGGATCVETLCDATGDGRVLATDALQVLKAAVGQITLDACGLRT